MALGHAMGVAEADLCRLFLLMNKALNLPHLAKKTAPLGLTTSIGSSSLCTSDGHNPTEKHYSTLFH